MKVCPAPGCPNFQPCASHQRDPQATWSRSRNLSEHQRWARAIKKRDNYTCQRCGSKDKLDAHHVSPTQGVTLCNTCHTLVDSHARLR